METYAVFVKTSTSVPGDQRSRDFPGHGYGAHTVDHTEVIEFKDRDKFVEWINRNSIGYYKTEFRAFKLTPVNVSTKTVIDIE